MADYNSSYTGKQIDEAVGRAVSGGAIDSAIAGKVDKVSGKGLSTNDFTDSLQSTLNSLATNYGDRSVVTTLGSDDTTIPTSKAVASAIGQAGGGDMMKSSYDTTGTGNKVDTALNAEKLGGTAASAYYQKPSSGIPSTDLTSAVQTLLNSISGKATTTTYTATIPIISGTSTTVTVSGILATDNPLVDVNFGSVTDTDTTIEDWAKVYRIVTSANTLTVYTTESTSVAIPIIIKVVR